MTDSHEHSKTVDIDIHICDQCTTLFNNPVYTDEGFKNLCRMGHSYGMSEGRSNEQIDYLRNIEFKQISSVLDLGCYRGELLSHFLVNWRKTESILIFLHKDCQRAVSKINFFCQDLENSIRVKNMI